MGKQAKGGMQKMAGAQKILKTRSYFKRFHTKLRRRRQCKTDYQARRTLIVQDKNKYNTPKYRLVVRITNKNVIAQLAAAKVVGDEIRASAYSHELPRYGVKAGLTNYAACYCTGLLLARRILKKTGLDKHYEGCMEPNGDDFQNEVNEDVDDDIKSPLLAFLDVGLAHTTTGARVFGVLKGAVDGGLDIPHRHKRFPGFFAKDKEDKDSEETFEPEIHRKYIFGGHVGEYMKKMQEESEDKYKAHFSQYIKHGINGDNIEEMYTNAHAAIRADPDRAQKKKPDLANIKTHPRRKKMSWAQRKARVQQKIRAALAKANA